MKSHLSNKTGHAVQKQTGIVVTYVYIKWRVHYNQPAPCTHDTANGCRFSPIHLLPKIELRTGIDFGTLLPL